MTSTTPFRRCPGCSFGTMRPTFTDDVLDAEAAPIMVRNVPVMRCDLCDEKTITGETFDVLTRLLTNRLTSTQMITIPVYDYQSFI
ncbi:MAG: hypothetical protein AB7R89_21565 [Dehalococcoidia bacterium]